jgi:hypothetical protein
MSSERDAVKGRRQFDLWILLEWTAAVAFLAALVSGSHGQVSWFYEFAQLPADDRALESWLEGQGHHDVQVIRNGQVILLRSIRRSWEFADPSFAFGMPRPPWSQLGYPAPRAMRGTSSWVTFSNSPYLWIVGLGTMTLLAFFRRRRTLRDQALPTDR